MYALDTGDHLWAPMFLGLGGVHYLILNKYVQLLIFVRLTCFL